MLLNFKSYDTCHILLFANDNKMFETPGLQTVTKHRYLCTLVVFKILKRNVPLFANDNEMFEPPGLLC